MAASCPDAILNRGTGADMQTLPISVTKPTRHVSTQDAEMTYAHVEPKPAGHIARRHRCRLAGWQNRQRDRVRNHRRSARRDCRCIHWQLDLAEARSPSGYGSGQRRRQRNSGRDLAAPGGETARRRRLGNSVGRRVAPAMVAVCSCRRTQRL